MTAEVKELMKKIDKLPMVAKAKLYRALGNKLQRPGAKKRKKLTKKEEAAIAKRQREAMLTFMKDMEKLPMEGPDDGFSGRDHDKILYGEPK